MQLILLSPWKAPCGWIYSHSSASPQLKVIAKPLCTQLAVSLSLLVSQIKVRCRLWVISLCQAINHGTFSPVGWSGLTRNVEFSLSVLGVLKGSSSLLGGFQGTELLAFSRKQDRILVCIVFLKSMFTHPPLIYNKCWQLRSVPCANSQSIGLLILCGREQDADET